MSANNRKYLRGEFRITLAQIERHLERKNYYAALRIVEQAYIIAWSLNLVRAVRLLVQIKSDLVYLVYG